MLGFSPYSAAAFSDVGSGEQLFVATGVASTGAIGTVSVTGNQSGLTLGSVQGSAVVNDVSVDAGATATFAMENGLASGLGTVIAFSDLEITLTGVAATGSPGTVTIINASVISPTGLEGTTNTPSVSITSNATFSVTGVAGTMSVGSAQGQAGAGADVTGVFATGSVGSVTIAASALVTPTGVSATGTVGQTLVWGRIKPDPGTVWTRIAA
jgi:hypothetical protein